MILVNLIGKVSKKLPRLDSFLGLKNVSVKPPSSDSSIHTKMCQKCRIWQLRPGEMALDTKTFNKMYYSSVTNLFLTI